MPVPLFGRIVAALVKSFAENALRRGSEEFCFCAGFVAAGQGWQETLGEGSRYAGLL